MNLMNCFNLSRNFKCKIKIFDIFKIAYHVKATFFRLVPFCERHTP